MRKAILSWVLLMLGTTTACAEGVVLKPLTPLPPGQRVVLPTPEPTPFKPPETRMEYAQFYTDQGLIAVREQSRTYRVFFWPVVGLLVLLWGFTKLLRWIYQLTTSSPSF